MRNPYEAYYERMHLCEYTYGTEKALWSRRLGSESMIVQHDARLHLQALERAWQKCTGKLNERCVNR